MTQVCEVSREPGRHGKGKNFTRIQCVLYFFFGLPGPTGSPTYRPISPIQWTP
jgi:hypothetical protein